MLKAASALTASSSFRKGLKDAFTIFEELASDSTVLGGQSAQSAIQGILATASLKASICEKQKGKKSAYKGVIEPVMAKRQDRPFRGTCYYIGPFPKCWGASPQQGVGRRCSEVLVFKHTSKI